MGYFLWEIAANPDEWPEDWENTETTGRQYHDDADAGIEISYQEILSYDDDLPNPFDDD